MHRQIAGKLTGRISKWIVLVGAVIALAATAPLNAKLVDVQNNEASSWLPGSAESTKVLEELTGTVDPNDIPTLVVYSRDGGLTDADLAAIDAQAAKISQLKGVTKEGAISPGLAEAARAAGQQGIPQLVSEDKEVAYTAFTYNFGKNGWLDLPDASKRLEKITKIDGVDVHLAGLGGQATDSFEAFEGIDTNLIMATLFVVIIILLFTYRSAFLWLLPIISAVFAYMISGGVVYLLAKYADLTVNGQSQSILGILVIGAGTDYALLLVARYREELRRHEDRHEAMAFALHRATPAILASAATVVVGLLCLVFADLNSTAGMGPVLAVGVGTTFLVMVTLLPALLVICGRWVFGPKTEAHGQWVKLGLGMIGGGVVAAVVGGILGGPGVILSVIGSLSAVLGLLALLQVGIEHWRGIQSRPAFGSVEPTSSGLWARMGERIKVRPRAVWVTTALLLGIACLGLLKLDASGLSTEETYTKKFDSIVGQSLLVDHGLSDTSNTVQVVAASDKVAAVSDAVAGTKGLAEPGPAAEFGDGRSYFEATILADVSSTDAFDIVEAARDAAHGVDGADALVGGGSAFYLDTKIASERDNRVIIPIILVVVFIILVLLLRSLISPLLLMGTVVLSFGAALGISTLIFTELFTRWSLFESNDGFAHADPGFPLFAFVFLVALGIDYNIFLMTRVREESMKHGTRKGSLIALSSTGGVITSAGLVLAATFLVLGTLPLVFLAQLGVAVALGVLLDTLIVRSVLVTALNLDLGGKIWWPSKLDRDPVIDPDAAVAEDDTWQPKVKA